MEETKGRDLQPGFQAAKGGRGLRGGPTGGWEGCRTQRLLGTKRGAPPAPLHPGLEPASHAQRRSAFPSSVHRGAYVSSDRASSFNELLSGVRLGQ